MLKSGDRLVLDHGSKVNGHAYRLFVIRAGGTGRSNFVGRNNGFLGWTARDAYNVLDSISETLYGLIQLAGDNGGTLTLNDVIQLPDDDNGDI